jgi:hypothetical protein
MWVNQLAIKKSRIDTQVPSEHKSQEKAETSQSAA